MSSGYVGCRPEEVQISDEKVQVNPATWTASCHGRTYYCSGTGSNGAAAIQCSDGNPNPVSTKN